MFIKQEKEHEEALLQMYNKIRSMGDFKDTTSKGIVQPQHLSEMQKGALP